VKAADVGRTLPAGAYHVADFAAPLTITLPAGWTAQELTPNSLSLANATDATVNIFFAVVDKVYTDPCHRETGPTAIGPAVDSLVDAFSSMPGFEVTDVKFVLVGGAAARSFTISNSINAAAANCSGDALALGTTNEDGDDVDITMFGGESDVFRVVNAGGTRVLVAVTNTPQIVEEVQPLVDRLLFDNRTCLIERCLNE